jgi:hypothetical protein
MDTEKPVLVAVISDTHCGSTLAPCPPEGPKLDDGGVYQPSKVQSWLWGRWRDYWDEVRRLRRQLGAGLIHVYNGDIYDGHHHGTTQVISGNPEVQSYIASELFRIPAELRPQRTFVIRGTEAHAGPSGSNEEAFAKGIAAEREPVAGTWSWWHLRLAVHGVRLDFQHHGRMGQRPWTEANVVNLLAAQIFVEHARRALPHPHLAIRSHYHRAGDSWEAHPVRVIQTPAWQVKTAYAHRVAAESIADVGGIIVIVLPDGTYDVKKVIFPVEPPEWIV